MVSINFNKEIWEGWTISDIIAENEPIMDMIASGQSYEQPFMSKDDIKKYLKENLMPAGCRKPAAINELVKYFAIRYGL